MPNGVLILSDFPGSKYRQTLAFLAFLSILLVVRLHSIIAVPRFWAEDGNLFWAQWESLGLASFWTTYAGYLHLVPRSIAAVAGMFPLGWTATIYVWAAIGVTCWTCDTIRQAVGGWSGVIAGLAPLIGNGWPEVLGTPTNLQWVMACGFIAIAASDNGAVLGGLNAYVFVAAAGLSGPFSFLLAPLFGARAVVAGRQRNWRGAGLCALAVALGVVQAIALVTSPDSPMGSAEAHSPLDAAWPAFRLSMLSTASVWAAAPVTVILLAGLLYGKRRSQRLLLAGCILILVTAAGLKFSYQPDIFDTGQVGLRYWYIPAVTWFFVAASLMRETRRWLSGLGVTLLAVLIAAQDWSVLARPEYGPTDIWSERVHAAAASPVEYHYPPGWSVVIPKQPP